MNVLLQASTADIFGSNIKITGSKSESNRLLVLQALYSSIIIENISNADDTKIMQKALVREKQNIDVHHAGTAMRFLTAFFAIQQHREYVITGSKRMTERPIGILVDALRELGAHIDYEENEGFPPLRIRGKLLEKYKITLCADTSSQYISALLLVAPKLPRGLELTLKGTIASVPYIEMTLALLNKIGIKTTFKKAVITVQPQASEIPSKTLIVESDWSSASYFYSIIALSKKGSQLTLSSYRKDSLQGDAALAKRYEKLGIVTHYADDTITLVKKNTVLPSEGLMFDLSDTPDIAQTIAVTCFGLGIGCKLSGLHTLKIKETDRLEALKIELSRLGASIEVTADEILLEPSGAIGKHVMIRTYEDHRMAMAFAPLALKVPIGICDADVVSKSYPDFWKDIEQLGIRAKEI